MPKVYLPLSVVCLLSSFLLLPVVKAGNYSGRRPVLTTIPNTIITSENAAAASSILYDSLKLGKIGLSREALQFAYRGQQLLARRGKLNQPSILTVCDFSQSSGNKRMYIIDIKNFKVLLNTYVAHGKNSGQSYAQRFSNKMKSLQSSLGFYITKGTYFGKNGLSLRLSGEDRGFNDNAENRAVVVHGADYVGQKEMGVMGRSFGCPAVPLSQASRVIDLIKGGTCLFIYYPNSKYLHSSKILNG